MEHAALPWMLLGLILRMLGVGIPWWVVFAPLILGIAILGVLVLTAFTCDLAITIVHRRKRK